MPKTNFLLKNITNIQKLLTTFSTLTNIKLFFYSIDQEIVDKEQILIHTQDVFNYLSKINFPTVTIFPTILNNALFGFFLLDIKATSKEQAIMYQSYLESICQRFQNKSTNSNKVHVLKPLDSRQLQKCINGLKIINNLSTFSSSDTKTSNDQFSQYYPPKGKHNINSYLEKAIIYINDNLDQSLTLKKVAQQIYLSPSYLSRLFKKDFNVNFIDYINLKKIAFAEEKMLKTSTSVGKLARELGFSQASYFTKIFKKKCGLTPSKYRIKNNNFKKIYTISRDLSWLNNQSVFQVSKNFFNAHHIKFQYQTLNGYPFVYAINDLGSDSQTYGWIYTVDFIQPITPPTRVTVGKTSIIQWIYTKTII